MDSLPSGSIFRELQVVHDTGYFSSQQSLEDKWQQVCDFITAYKMIEQFRSSIHEHDHCYRQNFDFSHRLFTLA